MDYPVIEFERVYHLGNLDPGEKKANLYANRGLFVSLHPEEWRFIARLGGAPLWQMSRVDERPGRFLDILELTKDQRASMLQEAARAGWLRPQTYFEWRRWDDEWEDTFISLYATRDEAIAEASLEDDGEIEGSIAEVEGFGPSDQLEALYRRSLSLGNAEECALEALLERTTDLDGLWWAQTLDPFRYSAPQGVIFNERLLYWQNQPL